MGFIFDSFCFRSVLFSVIGGLLSLLLPSLAFAARPFMTDDARITYDQSCQLESWVRGYRKSSESWAFPACNFTGNLEITAGTGRFKYDDIPSSSDYFLQGKSMIKDLETNGYGVALAVGKIFHPGEAPGPNGLGATYAYVPVTFSMLDDRAFIHTNLGWLRDRQTQRDNLTWGVGGEYTIVRQVNLMAETYGDNRSHPYWQAGVRVFLVPDRVQIDSTIGNQRYGDRDTRWFSVGIRLTPERLFEMLRSLGQKH